MRIVLVFFLVIVFIATKNVYAFEEKRVNKILKKNYHRYLMLNGYNVEGKATFYANKFHNRKTASGIKYSKYAYTAASVKLPLMSVVKVTNRRNGKSISVLINDRGPFKTNAILDLSKAAANKISLRSSSDNILVKFDLQKTLELVNNKKKLKKKLKSFGIQ